MHTVIIIEHDIGEPDIESEFAKYKHFFSPFFTERGGSVCCCRWEKEKSGEKIEDAVPGLYKAIEDHPEWRAIILVRSKKNDVIDYDDPKSFYHDNPFDFCINHKEEREGDLFLKQNQVPLVQLTHMLAGFPSLGVRKYDKAYVYYDEKLKKFETCTHPHTDKPMLESDFIRDFFNKKFYNGTELIKYTKECQEKKKPVIIEDYKKYCENNKICYYNAEEYENFKKERGNEEVSVTLEDFNKYCEEEARKKFREKVRKDYHGNNIQIKIIEVPYEPTDIKNHKKLTKEKYAFKQNRPVEVLLLSMREQQHTMDDRDKTRDEIKRSWEVYDDADSTDFWKIYPNTCRFLYYDIVNKGHTLYSCELWRFFLLALTLAINKIPGQALQAYSLYNVDLQIDTEELKNGYNRYLEKLLSLKEIYHERMSRIPELTQEKNEELVPKQYISVDFGQVEESDVMAESKNIGLATDCPEDEALFWHRHMHGIMPTVDNILFAPQEIVARKAVETRDKIDDFTGIEQVLDRFQRDRINKRIDDLEPHVMNTILYNMLDTKKYKAEIIKAGEAVQKYIKLRLTKRKVLFISLVSLLIYLCGYIPYLINSAKIGWDVFGWASALVIAALVILAGGAFLSILFLRGRLINKIKKYNDDIFNIFNNLKYSAKDFSSYFSNVCTYMYANSLLSGEIWKKNKDLSKKEIYEEHLKYIKNESQEYTKLCEMYGVPIDITEENGSFEDINDEELEKLPSQSNLYKLDRFLEENTVKLTSSVKMKQDRKYLTNKSNDHWDLSDTGITLNAPYSFISGLNLMRDEIYKKEVV